MTPGDGDRVGLWRDDRAGASGHPDTGSGRRVPEDVAYRLGLLLAEFGTSDVVDAHVALLARRLHATVLTSDPDDLTALDPTLTLVTL